MLSLCCVGAAGPLLAQTDYVVGPQDVLTITVFGEAELSGKYTVEQDGTFTFPLIGRVKAGGMTLRELEQELKKQLADGYLKNPQVDGRDRELPQPAHSHHGRGARRRASISSPAT